MKKGFKVFNPDWTCNGFQYEVGKTFEMKESPKLCNIGFHFCKAAVDCFNYYGFNSDNKVAEIIAHGEIAMGDDKSCTNKIEIVREIPWSEVLEIVNFGKSNTGYRNTGHSNTGCSNTGHSNTGCSNTGYRNTGHRNTGDRNTGHRNTGDSNTGYRNTGYRNTGHSNTGDRNTGHSNTGCSNTGHRNTGDWNLTDNETGCFCSEQHKIRIFDIESEMSINEWRNSSAYGILYFAPYSADYLNKNGIVIKTKLNKARQEWWNNLPQNKRQAIKNIPNFNATKFKKITGIDVREGK